LLLSLRGPGKFETKSDRRNYTPSFHMLNQVLGLVYSLRDMLS